MTAMRTERGRLAAVIFDLDGTLTDGGHDFAEIKRRLGLDPSVPLTEGLMALPEPQRGWAWAAVEAWEEELALRAVPMPGVMTLLEALAAAGWAVGVLTRNTRTTALRTLQVAGLDRLVAAVHVVGRHDAPAKPDPAGVRLLLGRWAVPPAQACMVGDAPHDTAAGRTAGTWAVGLDPAGRASWGDVDAVVADLSGLQRWLGL